MHEVAVTRLTAQCAVLTRHFSSAGNAVMAEGTAAGQAHRISTRLAERVKKQDPSSLDKVSAICWPAMPRRQPTLLQAICRHQPEKRSRQRFRDRSMQVWDLAEVMTESHAATAKLQLETDWLAHHVFQGIELVVEQVGKVLVVHADLEVVVALDHAVQGLQLARHQLQQRGLASSVGPHQGYAGVQVHPKVHLQTCYICLNGLGRLDVAMLAVW